MIYISLFIISTTLLALEIVWIQLLSFQQWYHVASLVISLAMLGFAASGTYISFFQKRNYNSDSAWQRHYRVLAFFYVASLPLSYLVLQQLPLDPFLLLWDLKQWAFLFIYCFSIFFPFFLGATCIGMLFGVKRLGVSGIYFINLLGSGLGVLLATGLLYIISVKETFGGIILFSLLGAILVLPLRQGRQKRLIVPGFAVGLLITLFVLTPIRISPHKPLVRYRQMPDTNVTAECSGPWGIVHVLEGASLRSMPGLSLQYKGDIPQGKMIFVNGDSVGFRMSAREALEHSLDFFSDNIQALPYFVLNKPATLIIGVGGGMSSLQALSWGASRVTIVERHPFLLQTARNWLEGIAEQRFPGQIRTYHWQDGRGFLQRLKTPPGDKPNQIFDLIQWEGLGSSTSALSGTSAFQSNYLLTTEAFGEMFDHLGPQGIIAFTFWVHMPPRENLKLFAAISELLSAKGFSMPGRHIFVARGWSACTTLVSRSPLTGRQIELLRSVCKRRDFDLVYYPGISPAEVNKHHLLERPFYHEAINALFGPRADTYLEEYPLYIRPATDEKPYFYRFFRLKTFSILFKELAMDWVYLQEWGYLLLWATLAASVVFGGLMILPGLLFYYRRISAFVSRRNLRFIFFGCLGSAFIFLEILFMEQIIFFLSFPFISVIITLSAILFFSALGSLTAGFMTGQKETAFALKEVCLGVGILAFLCGLGLMPLFRLFITSPLWLRALIAFIVLAPICFLMGMPFPLAMQRVREIAPEEVPICWGLNGWASVVFAVLAPLYAIHFGLSKAFYLASGIYLAAACIGAAMFAPNR